LPGTKAIISGQAEKARRANRAEGLPGSVNAEGAEFFGFRIVEIVLDEVIDAAAAGAAAQFVAELVKVIGRAGSHDFDFAFLGVADPTAQADECGFALDKPAETDTLHTAANEEVKNHC
jgi:hypothetical protein